MRWIGWGIGLALSLSMAGNACAGGNPLVFYGHHNLPPFEFLEDGEPKGADVDLARAVGRILDRPVVIRLTEWGEAQERVRAGDGDALMNFGRTREREAEWAFTQPTLDHSFSFFMWATPDGPAAVAPGQRVGANSGALPAIILAATRPDVELVPVADPRDGMRRLQRGEIDALATETWTGLFLLKQLNIMGVDMAVPPFHRLVVSMAVRSDDASLRDRMDAALTTIKASGEFDRIVDRWSGARVHLFTEDQIRTSYHAGSVVAAAVLLLLTALVVVAIQCNALTREVAWRRHIEAELVQAKAQAESANRAKTTFLAAASHDLRQPFQALRLFLDLLSPYVPATGSGRVVLGHAVTAYEGAERLLTALMEISRLEAGAERPVVETVSLAPMLTELANEGRPVAAAKGLSLRLYATEAAVDSDPVLLKRILRNLMVNAIRYTDSGGVLLTCRRRDGQVVAEVWDTGCGIPDDQISKIFEDFYQLDRADRGEVKGMGLGLAIVAKTARLLGHRIGVRSRPGRGSVFSVEMQGGRRPYEKGQTVTDLAPSFWLRRRDSNPRPGG